MNGASTPRHKNAIGALRVLLAGMVIFSHAHLLGGFDPEWLKVWSHGSVSLGTVGVQCFFALSGWLIATSWRRQPLLGRFLWHRFLRLAPALWVCLVVTAFVFTPVLWLTDAQAPAHFFGLDPSPAGYVWRNLFFPRSQISIGPYPNGWPWGGDWNGSLWSLFYEGACYLMIAGLGLAGLLTRRRLLGALAIGTLLTLSVVGMAAHPAWLPAITSRLFDTPGKRLSLHFLAGAMGACWPERMAALLSRKWIGILAACVLIASWHMGIDSWLSPLVLPPALLMLAMHGPRIGIEKHLGGDYSYGLYIYGYPALQGLAYFHVNRLGFAPFFIIGLALTSALAFASWHLVEKRALSLRAFTWHRVPVLQSA